MGRLTDKVCLITGTASGIGKATAELFAIEDAIVVCTDIDRKNGKKVVEQLKSKNKRCTFYHLDVTNEDSWKNVIDSLQKAFGKLDVLINNAGQLLMKTIQDTSLNEWEFIQKVNVTSMFLGTKLALPLMRKSNGASIVNLSSIYGLVGAPNAVAYEASKGAIRLFTKGAAAEYAEHGIRVNSVHPGVIETPMADHLLADTSIRSQILGPTLLRRAGKPNEIAAAILFLASDDASFMVGSELVVDGGYSCV